MATKKKPTIELAHLDMSFTKGETTYKLLRFYQKDMTVDVMVYEKDIKQGIQKIPFAQLPKELKKELNPK